MKKAVVIWVCAVLMASVLVGMNWQDGTIVEAKEITRDSATYISHVPLRINSNAQFASKAISEGWNGSGTLANPWVIENYDINGTGFGYCIFIGNISQYFIIRNCYLHNAQGSTSALWQDNTGLNTYNIWNCIITKCLFSNNSFGIKIDEMDNRCELIENNFFNCGTGIEARHMYNSIISQNNMKTSTASGIHLFWSDFNEITNNTLNNVKIGLFIESGSDNNILTNNTVIYCASIGIILQASCFFNRIESNNISINNEGIRISISENNIVKNNLIQQNSIGARLFGKNNIFYHNRFIDNTDQVDSYDINQYDNGYPSCGNYWSDYMGGDVMKGVNQDIIGPDCIGDTAYLIDGTSHDHYPLMDPWVTGATFYPHAPIRINSNADFTPSNGVSSGDGSLANPWIIENFEINGTGTVACIYVGNTTDYFIIQNCSIHDMTGGGYYPEFSPSGIYLFNVSNGRIERNNVVRCIMNPSTPASIRLFHSSNCKIIGNFISVSDGRGVWISESHNNDVHDNYIQQCFYGIEVSFDFDYSYNLNYNNLTNNIISNCTGVGIYCDGYDSTISNNTIHNTTVAPGSGMYLCGHELTVINNIIKNNELGMFLYCYESSIHNNSFFNDGIYVAVGTDNKTMVSSNNVSDNTVNGLPIVYICNQNNKTVSSGVGQAIVINSEDISISNINIIPPEYGIEILYSTNILLQNITIFTNRTSSCWPFSIMLDWSYNVTIIDNYINSNSYAIYLRRSDNCHIMKNTFLTYSETISLSYSNSNLIYENNISSAGMPLSNNEGLSNKIYHNNFLAYTVGPYDQSSNYYDNGYPSGGNYWASYTGTDNYCGPTQSLPGSDHIGDTRYKINIYSKYDNYPLMQPFVWWEDVAPSIELISPLNNSIIKPGAIITLSIWDCNVDLIASNYSRNGEANQSLNATSQIDTTGWLDGEYILGVHAADDMGNAASEIFIFTIDSTNPVIILNSPVNNSLISAGTILDFNVIDIHIDNLNYSVNGGVIQAMVSPYDINTGGWPNGIFEIQIQAIDKAGNSAVNIYSFTIDFIPPIITLNTPVNNSLIPSGTILDFNIDDPNSSVNYSVNSGVFYTLSSPYDIDTSGWLDGVYNILIYAIDTACNEANETFVFTFDSTAPLINMQSPANNSFISPGTTIDFMINDTHLESVTYSVGGAANQSFVSPYDVDTSGWTDGTYFIEIYAYDEAGNVKTEIFQFTIDSTKPLIVLNSPGNNSVIKSGIVLDFSVSDANLNTVVYSVNGGVAIPFLTPYNISTSGWLDGSYSVRITAKDFCNNTLIRIYSFVLDSTTPVISLNSPANNSLFKAGTIIDLSVIDSNILAVTFSVNSGPIQNLNSPYNIFTTGWLDGVYTIQATAVDVAGNADVVSYQFSIDSTTPSVILNSPANNSEFKSGPLLDFSVIDINLNIVNYSINSGSPVSFNSPYDISTTGWSDGVYAVKISAIDTAGNAVVRAYTFTIDSTLPESCITPFSEYWIPSSSLAIFATVNSTITITNITLWYRFSSDNITWGSWASFGTDSTTPWSWDFNFPDDDGYYEFYSVACDVNAKIETAPTVVDTLCAFDATAPQIIDSSPATATTGDICHIHTVVTDNLNLFAVRVIYWFGTGTQTNTTMLSLSLNNYCINVSIPSNSLDTLSYRIVSMDKSGNWNSTIVKSVLILDDEFPTVSAGADRSVDANTLITFNGTSCTDNIGITNYTWTFNDGVGNITLYGVNPTHIFTTVGNWAITLTARDGTGNAATDAMIVSVNQSASPDSDGDNVPDDEDAFPEDPLEWLDSDNDGTGDNSDAFPDDLDESVDSDDDGIGNNADPDDDGDGYLDEWEIFLDTDPLDSIDKPVDTNSNGIPDGDATNSQAWMDTDDDGDDVPDDEETPPPVEESNFLGDYWWLILLIVVITVIGLMVILRHKPVKPTEAETSETEPTPEPPK